ncbi:MAG: AAA family ATPase [Armatimonadota bacterium]
MPTETIACWNCGQENPATAKFCPNCGKPQRTPCPECGAPLDEGAKFCANCGIPVGAGVKARLDAGPVLTAEARKVVTVVFADLVSSTGLTERLDPEEAREVVGKFYGVVRHAVERTGGTVANLLGDAVLAVFGLPVTHEDDPERAVRAGLDIRDALPTLNEHLHAAHGVRLETRVGVNTGEVVAASGSTFDRDFLISDAVTTAARLQQTVSPGVVVVGERTYRLTRDVIEYRECPPMEVKGKATPVRVWEAVEPLPERPDVRRIAAPLVGRHAELGLLRNLYQRSCDEAIVHMVTVLGQAGVGKSRLLREFLAEVRDLDPRPLVLRGRSVAFGGRIGYHALLDILRTQAGLMDTDPPEIVRAKLTEWLRERLPQHAGLLGGLLQTFGADAVTPTDPGEARRMLFDTWQTLIAALAADRPVILALEDIHWADDGVLDLVEWVAESIESAPLFLICLGRPELRERRATWGGGGRNATTMDLKPLRAREAEDLVAHLSSQGLTSELQQTIAHRAGGNPLFVEELVRMLMEGSGPGAAIPDTVQAVLTARIDRLPPQERRVLQAASVLDRKFWPSAVAPLAGLFEEETIKAIEDLIKKELVVARPQSSIAGEREYAFRHILTRDVAYGMLPRSQRQRAHGEAGRWLETRLGERVEEAVEIVAEHFRMAGDDARAAPYLQRAGNKARRQYDNDNALRLFDQALEAAARAGAPKSDIARIRGDRGEVHQLRGAYKAALDDFEQGLAAARDGNDRALEAVLENRVGLIHHRELRLDQAEAHFRRAAALAREAENRLTLGLSLVDLANVAWDRGRLGPDDTTLVEGIGFLRETGDKSSLARGLNLMCMAKYAAGYRQAAIVAAQEGLAAAREAGDKSRQATSLSYLSVINSFWGNYEDAIRDGEAAIALAKEIDDKRRLAFTLSFVAHARGSLGEWGEALGQLESSLPLVAEYAKVHLPFPSLYLAEIYYEIGDVERARTMLAPVAKIEAVNPSWQMVKLAVDMILTLHDHDTGALERALEEIGRLPWEVFVPDDGEMVLPMGEVLLETGRIEELRQFLRDRRPVVERWGAPPHLAALEIFEGHLALRDGNSEQALVHIDKAVQLGRSVGDVFTIRRALELRLHITGSREDHEPLRALLSRLAASLPDDLRATFLASPRAAVLRE